MSKASLIDILNDEKQELKEDFKRQVAQNIVKRFENPLPHDYVVFGPAYCEQRAKKKCETKEFKGKFLKNFLAISMSIWMIFHN